MKQPRMNRILQVAFNGLEICDAKTPLLLFPTQDDFEKGTRMDPRHCGFANCAARACGSTQAHFFKRYVYIDHLGDDGKLRVYRYIVSSGVSDAIEAFDRGVQVKAKRAFVLRAPGPSETLQGMRKANKKWMQSDSFKAIRQETQARQNLIKAERQLKQAESLAEKVDAKPDSAKAREIEKRVSSAKIELKQARNALDTASRRAKEVRKATYGTAKAKPRKHDLRVRSGSGAWIKTINELQHSD